MDKDSSQYALLTLGVLTLVGGTIAYFLSSKSTSTTQNSQSSSPHEKNSEKIQKLYKLDIPYDQERALTIQKIEIFPCRGIKGIEVDQVKVYPDGIKYDREWTFIDKEKKTHYAMAADFRLSMLRQRIEKDPFTKKKTLVISVVEGHEDIVAKLPTRELRVEMVLNPEGEVITNEKYSGYLEPLYTEEWISAFVGKPVQMLRSPPKRVVPLNKKLMIHSEEDDRKKNMVSKAALHFINEASVRDLKTRVLNKYNPEEHSKFKIESQTMRANFIFDSEVAYEEDSFVEARIGTIMLRIVGYCSRCMAVPINFDTFQLNPEDEPNTTLKEYRKHPTLGVLFGTYCQVDVIPSPLEYNKLLRGYPPVATSRFHSEYGIVKKGDELRVRVQDQKLKL